MLLLFFKTGGSAQEYWKTVKTASREVTETVLSWFQRFCLYTEKQAGQCGSVISSSNRNWSLTQPTHTIRVCKYYTENYPEPFLILYLFFKRPWYWNSCTIQNTHSYLFVKQKPTKYLKTACQCWVCHNLWEKWLLFLQRTMHKHLYTQFHYLLYHNLV